MSATIGTRAARTICRNAAVDSTSGHDTRMMSAPASSQRRIWSIVAFASAVSVLVIVCTVIGASPPTATVPTMICRDLRRAMSRQGRTDIFEKSHLSGADIRELHDEPKACRFRACRYRGLARCGGSSSLRAWGQRDHRGRRRGATTAWTGCASARSAS